MIDDIAPDSTIVTYATAGVWLTAGFYKLDELRSFVANLERMNKRSKEYLHERQEKDG